MLLEVPRVLVLVRPSKMRKPSQTCSVPSLERCKHSSSARGFHRALLTKDGIGRSGELAYSVVMSERATTSSHACNEDDHDRGGICLCSCGELLTAAKGRHRDGPMEAAPHGFGDAPRGSTEAPSSRYEYRQSATASQIHSWEKLALCHRSLRAAHAHQGSGLLTDNIAIGGSTSSIVYVESTSTLYGWGELPSNRQIEAEATG